MLNDTAVRGKLTSELWHVTCYKGSHTMLPATRHRCMKPTLIPARKAGT